MRSGDKFLGLLGLLIILGGDFTHISSLIFGENRLSLLRREGSYLCYRRNGWCGRNVRDDRRAAVLAKFIFFIYLSSAL